MVNSPLLKETSDKSQTCKGFQTHPLDWNGSTCNYSLRAEHDILNTTNYCCCASILTIHPRTKHVYTSRSAMLNLYRWFHKKVSLYTKYNYIPMCKAYICNSSCSGTWCWDPHDALRDVAKILVLVWIDYRWGIWTLISRQNLKLFFGLESFFLLNVRSRNSTCS